MVDYTSSFTGAEVDTAITTVTNSNLSSSYKITRGPTLVIAASDTADAGKSQADYVCDGTADDVQIQAALDALPSTGGEIRLCEGTFQLAAALSRAIDNVTWSGAGYSTYIIFDNVTPVISTGTQANWLFNNFRTDNGGLDIEAGVSWGMTNIWRKNEWDNVSFIDSWSEYSINKNAIEDLYGVTRNHKGIKIFSDFETDGVWSVSGAALTYDTSIKYTGSRSAKIVCTGGTQGLLTAIASLPDLTNCSASVMVYITDYTKVDSIEIDMRTTDTTWNHYYKMDCRAIQHLDNSWFKLVFPALVVGAGTPDFTLPTQIRLRVKPVAGQDCTVYFDQLCYWKRNLIPNGAVTFTFDDGKESTSTTAKPILDTFNFPAVIGYVTSRMTPTTAAQARTLQNSGWDVVSHSLDHVDARMSSEPKNQYLLAQKWLMDNGFSKGARFVLLPFGSQNNDIIPVVRDNYQFARTAVAGYNSIPGPSKMLNTQIILSTVSVATAKSWIDCAVQDGTWLNIMLHDIVNDPTDTSWSPADFTELVTYCNTVGIEVLTYSQIVDRIKNSAQTLELSGSGTLPNGSTSVNIRHGFSAAPSKIFITPTSSLGTAAAIWVSSKDEGATGNFFKVSVNADPGADVTFDWRAIL